MLTLCQRILIRLHQLQIITVDDNKPVCYDDIYTTLQEDLNRFADDNPAPFFSGVKFISVKVDKMIECFNIIPADFTGTSKDIDTLLWNKSYSYRKMDNKEDIVKAFKAFFDSRTRIPSFTISI